MHLNEHQDSDQVMEEIKNQLFDRITMLEQKDIINFAGSCHRKNNRLLIRRMK